MHTSKKCVSKLFLFKQDFTPNLISFIISEDHLLLYILLILLLYILYHYQYYSDVPFVSDVIWIYTSTEILVILRHYLKLGLAAAYRIHEIEGKRNNI